MDFLLVQFDYTISQSIFKVKKAIIDFIENINKAPTQTIDRLCIKM